MDDLEKQLKKWKKRMKARGEREQKEKDEEAEKLRQQYLKRTGRKEMKP